MILFISLLATPKMLSLKFDWTLTKFIKEQLFSNSELMVFDHLFIDAKAPFIPYDNFYYRIILKITYIEPLYFDIMGIHSCISVFVGDQLEIDSMDIKTIKDKINFLRVFIDKIYDPNSKISAIYGFHKHACGLVNAIRISNTIEEYASHIIRKHWRRYYYSKRAKVIQRKWRYVIANPNYAVCRSRLLREFKELVA